MRIGVRRRRDNTRSWTEKSNNYHALFDFSKTGAPHFGHLNKGGSVTISISMPTKMTRMRRIENPMGPSTLGFVLVCKTKFSCRGYTGTGKAIDDRSAAVFFKLVWHY
jgi:hypothetical protein